MSGELVSVARWVGWQETCLECTLPPSYSPFSYRDVWNSVIVVTPPILLSRNLDCACRPLTAVWALVKLRNQILPRIIPILTHFNPDSLGAASLIGFWIPWWMVDWKLFPMRLPVPRVILSFRLRSRDVAYGLQWLRSPDETGVRRLRLLVVNRVTVLAVGLSIQWVTLSEDRAHCTQGLGHNLLRTWVTHGSQTEATVWTTGWTDARGSRWTSELRF